MNNKNTSVKFFFMTGSGPKLDACDPKSGGRQCGEQLHAEVECGDH